MDNKRMIGMGRTAEVLLFGQGKVIKLFHNEYQRLSGLGLEDIDKWMVPLAAARLVEWVPNEEKEKLIAFIRERL